MKLGDSRDLLRSLPSSSVHATITSPPYWNLRDYGTGEGGIGREPTPEDYIASLVELFRELRTRVLRPDGTLWLNLGDSRAGSGNSGGTSSFQPGRTMQGKGWRSPPPGSQAKQKLMIPARVALALQADGWWLREEIIWAKGVSFLESYSGSCMPDSARDRFTPSHEQLFLLSPSPSYHFDLEAVKERGRGGGGSPGHRVYHLEAGCARGGGERRRLWEPGTARKPRTVWVIPPSMNRDPELRAHFATFPQDLVRPCVRAGTSERGACPECGSPWERIVEREGKTSRQLQTEEGESGYASSQPPGRQSQGLDFAGGHGNRAVRRTRTVGWRASCEHEDLEPVPCVVLDPFCGSGTTGEVCLQEGRSFLGLELSEDYAEMSRRRLARVTERGGEAGDAEAETLGRPTQLGLW